MVIILEKLFLAPKWDIFIQNWTQNLVPLALKIYCKNLFEIMQNDRTALGNQRFPV